VNDIERDRAEEVVLRFVKSARHANHRALHWQREGSHLLMSTNQSRRRVFMEAAREIKDALLR
jgi:hypothetical protein